MITVICPVYNEEAYIKHVLDFCVSAAPTNKEVFFIDGNSSDKTKAIIQEYSIKYPFIKLLHNSQQYVPFALNIAIKQASGDIIIRLDAHTEYANDYFEKIIQTFQKTKADIVGGPMRIAKGSNIQNAIGYATSTMFGVGNSSFHFENFEGFTDSVYLGAWKKNIFETTGLFDESMMRNQDDEFHYRAKSFGFKIYQSPEIKLYYYPRNSFKKLFKQYFQYGLYKPVVLKKVSSAISLRHFIPALFVLYLASVPFLLAFKWHWLLLPLLLYVFINFYFSCRAKQNIPQTFRIFYSYLILHLSYGIGFIKGLIKKPV